MTTYRTCAVPMCNATTVKYPDKLFIHVPKHPNRRKQWLQLARRDPKFTSDKSAIFFCEDHFDLPNDMENYIQYSVMGSVGKIRMKPDCFPSKFECQLDRIKRTAPPQPRSAVNKRRVDVILEIMSEKNETPSSMTSYSGYSKMVNNENIFHSNLLICKNKMQNNLQDLLQIKCMPIKAIENNEDSTSLSDFQPRTDKSFLPKKKYKQKVKTVRDVRKEYENYVYSYLLADLEKQRLLLYKKIKNGSLRDSSTIQLTKNVIEGGEPICRSVWQMITNVNPYNHIHSAQFVLWNGQNIRINGSSGGTKKFLTNYDLQKNKNIQILKKQIFKKKNSLLKNSLIVKFRPGPLRKKQALDDSHQKFSVGCTGLINLPTPILEIVPSYGSTLDPLISNYLLDIREKDGLLTEKWAEFAVSTLGTIVNKQPVSSSEDTVIFKMSYKNKQKRIIMRRSIDCVEKECDHNLKFDKLYQKNNDLDKIELKEIKSILENILDTVEISVNQDSMYIMDELRPMDDDVYSSSPCTQVKERNKKNFELQRLDVTIIRLPENTINDSSKHCVKSFCKLGCVCSSIQGDHILKPHCGRFNCMFQCKCNFSEYNINSTLENTATDIIPGLINLNNKINSGLSREEQKFHQTVVVTDDKSILLKGRKRNWKSSKKYSDFYNGLPLKNEDDDKCKNAFISLVRLPCENIQIWCMVHELYNCFCKGKILDGFTYEHMKLSHNDAPAQISPFEKVAISDNFHKDYKILEQNNNCDNRPRKRTRRFSVEKNQNDNKGIVSHGQLSTDEVDIEINQNKFKCSRTEPFIKRNYEDKYYFETNKKVIAMEKNDANLSKKLMEIYNKSTLTYRSLLKPNFKENDESNFLNITSRKIGLPNKETLIIWLETHYKQYQKRLVSGHLKVKLEAPTQGKVSLHPWEVILGRYKEKKNYFLVTKNEPIHIYITVNRNNSVFSKCIDINDIRFVDLHKYPATVKHLLTNSDDAKNNFYILYGLTHCWELVGSVTKIKDKNQLERTDENELNDLLLSQCSDDLSASMASFSCDSNEAFEINSNTNSVEQSLENSDTSKWFVMTIENDFSEIQFPNKGFFVKNENIVKALSVAKTSGKTVRLSAQTRVKEENLLLFGVYAIPNVKEPSLFIGPYERDEELGIEIIRKSCEKTNKKTRGMWLHTKKVDNDKILENPSYFLPQIERNESMNIEFSKLKCASQQSDIVKDKISDVSIGKEQVESNPQDFKVNKPNEKAVKIVKPIKICKTNGFYHLAPDGSLKPISLINSRQSSNCVQKEIIPPLFKSVNIVKSPVFNEEHEDNIETNLNMVSDNHKISNVNANEEIATQVQVTSTDNALNSEPIKKVGMSILKPEEINRRIFENKISCNYKEMKIGNNTTENFISASNIHANSTLIIDTLIISDDETNFELDSKPSHREVWIECTNVDNFGAIRAKTNEKKKISFEFPGFKYTIFYTEPEAFVKINEVLSRKIFLPKSLDLTWRVVNTFDELKYKHILQKQDLGSDYVITKQGIRLRKDILKEHNSEIRTSLQELRDTLNITPNNCVKNVDLLHEAEKIINNLKIHNNELQEEKEFWESQNALEKSKLLNLLLKAPDDIRCKILECLNNMNIH